MRKARFPKPGFFQLHKRLCRDRGTLSRGALATATYSTSITKQYNQLPYFALLSTPSYSRSRCTQDISYPGAPHSKKQAFSRGFPLLHVILFLRKEVIQPHLPIRLPCYDFTPVTGPTFDCSLLTVGSQASGVTDSHGVTGGVYKTRERIHRDILIRDY